MREFLKTILYGMGIVFLFSLTRFTVQATKDIHQTAIQAQLTMTEVATTARTTRAQVAGISGMIEETRKAIRQARTLIDVALKTSLAERENVQKSSDETVALLGHADELIANLDSRTQSITDSLSLTADQAQKTLAESSKAMDAAAGLMSDPEIHQTLANLATTSNNAALMSADAQKKFHLMLFPPKQPWYLRTLHLVETGGQLTFDALTLK